ncbi:protein FAM178B [Sagmatias obliquidens]|uniref:protein FAM178B n=1 Tax=Sagmatias obliquidens TaxID=3371155 RepID=UPI000F44232B|nr:protein FAM178B [Lagenorhynchus obliquidens]
MQADGDMFPSDWSPPPVEFLKPRAPLTDSGAPAQRQAGTAGPRGLRRLAHQLPKESKQESQDPDPVGGLASLEEPFWSMAGTSPKAAAPWVDAHTSIASGDSECYVNSLDYLLQEKRQQALEQEREKLLLQDCLDLYSSDPDNVPLTPEHRATHAWHSQSWALSESLNAAHGWGRIWDQDSGSWTKALREGLGSDREWEGEGLLSLYLSAPPPSAGGAVSLGWSQPGGGCRAGAAIWSPLASLQAADQVCLLTPGSPASCFARKLVDRFSVSLQVIPAVHPGETVFLPRQHPLPCILDCSHLKPQSRLEELFLSSPPAQQLSFLRSGLLSSLYLPSGLRPVPLLRWLFQLLTWPPETSLGAFGLLWDLSVDGLFRPSDADTSLWCPSLQEVTAAFHSLGTHSPALQPPGPLQRDGSELKSEASLSRTEQQDTPQETALDSSLSHICKFLMLCVLAQPGAYTDGSLLGLIELLCRAGLDVGLRLLPKTDLQQLLLLLLDSIQEWPGKLRQLCCALSRASDHHHNLLALVQLFLDVTPRSRQLRRQLSLVIIARLLDQQGTLPLWQEKAQLSSLRHLLSLMRPSTLGQYLGPETMPPGQEKQPKASAQLDHKVCYLCHSLLTLAGLVVSGQDITPDQWGELQLLCMQLDRCISTHIRESPQAMHWTTLKDLAAQTYIRWQELLIHCQPQTQYFSPWEDI